MAATAFEFALSAILAFIAGRLAILCVFSPKELQEFLVFSSTNPPPFGKFNPMLSFVYLLHARAVGAVLTFFFVLFAHNAVRCAAAISEGLG